MLVRIRRPGWTVTLKVPDESGETLQGLLDACWRQFGDPMGKPFPGERTIQGPSQTLRSPGAGGRIKPLKVASKRSMGR